MKRELLEKEYVESYRQGNSCLTSVVLIVLALFISLLIIGIML
jgi:hypothetical protein